MSIKEKSTIIILNIIPILIMIGLIPLIENDYPLLFSYIVLIVASLFIYREEKDLKVFLFGFIGLTIAEAIFISTGVETFVRNSLFGLMPIWLPVLWGYSFIAIKRLVRII